MTIDEAMEAFVPLNQQQREAKDAIIKEIERLRAASKDSDQEAYAQYTRYLDASQAVRKLQDYVDVLKAKVEPLCDGESCSAKTPAQQSPTRKPGVPGRAKLYATLKEHSKSLIEAAEAAESRENE